MGFPGGVVVKNLFVNAADIRDGGLIPGSGRFPGGGNGSPLQYSCLENPVDGGAWQAIVHRGRKESDTTERLSPHTYALALIVFCLVFTVEL